MPQILITKDVKADDVDLLTAAFKKAKAISVEKKEQSNGKYTLTATFPDPKK
ncbi:hypothetical protein [Rhodopseudomonas pseudopalustris]|uniref:30S ribosomal protein S6 n=1 Tax=Rhodopseudomonas pseudopalustris TaxID=1513892 RepID=A0A1H8LCG2_9BRAD|nr:hypothetical protein [Rhodopseudomonas pseudopalustris]MBB1094063.1 hypothetical protein [Rhodopseudomonas palustris]SEO02428.1 hypothetical protein SAMN05444123_1012 [Rhodopseudomonas pseudopalustris]